jgi:hypothetical protein
VLYPLEIIEVLLLRALLLALLGLVRLQLHVLLAASKLNRNLGVLRRVQLAHVLCRALKVVSRPVAHAGLALFSHCSGGWRG